MSREFGYIDALRLFAKTQHVLSELSAISYQIDFVAKENSKSFCIAKKNTEKAIVPGSILKIITLFLLFETSIKLNTKIKIESSDLMKGSGNNLKIDDLISVKNLAKNMFYASSNSSAEVLKRLIEQKTGKDFQSYVEQYLKPLGLKKTVVKNAHGLFERVQQTSVEDFMKILQRVLKNKSMLSFLYRYEKKCQVKIRRDNKTQIIFNFKQEYPCILKTGSLYPNVFNAILIKKVKKNYFIACLGYCTNVTTRKQDIAHLLLLI